MAIHDNHNLGSANPPLFVKDNSNLLDIAKAEQEKIKAEQARIQAEKDRIGSLGNSNDLDLSYHNYRVWITSKKNSKRAVDTGGPPADSDPPGKGVKTVVHWNGARWNQNQWIRLIKSDVNNMNSGWLMQCDRNDYLGKDNNRYQFYIYGYRGKCALLPNITTNTTAYWTISNEGGYWRFKNWMEAPHSNYLDVSEKTFDGDGGPMVTKPRAEGDARDFQLFTIEKLTNIPLAMSSPPQFLKKSYDKARVVINTASGMRCLDLGAGASDGNAPPGAAWCRTNEDGVSTWQILYLERLRDAEDTEWRIKALIDKSVWYLTVKPDNDFEPWRTKDPSTPTADHSLWHIKQTPSGLFRIQSKKSGMVLDAENLGNVADLKLNLDDAGAMRGQLWSIAKLPQLLDKPAL